MQSFKLHVGIDVSKAKLDVCLVSGSVAKKHQHFVVPNSFRGINDIVKKITQNGVSLNDTLFCFEHTGLYSVPLCYALEEQKAFYWVVPAIEIKKAKGITRGKTDKADAKDIAFYAITHAHKMKLSSLPEKDIVELRLLMSEREKVVKSIGAFDTTREASNFLPKEVLKETLRLNRSILLMLRKKLKQLDEAISRIVKASAVMNKQFELATSIPGVGPQTATYLIVYTRCFQSFANWRKFACYAGIAPFDYYSGSSVKGRAKISHIANKKLKTLLNMAALSAKKYDPGLRLYYERKVNEGKNPMLVMNAIRCKVVSRIFSVVHRETPYVNIQKFAA